MSSVITAPGDDIGLAAQSLLPGLRQEVRRALGLAAFVGLVGAGLAAAIISSGLSGKDKLQIGLFLALFGGFALVLIYKTMRRRQEALVMPVLARSIGLDYSKDAQAFLSALPRRLLPQAASRKAEDLVSGTLGAHAIHLAEVFVETGGKNSRTLFRGVVARFPNRIAMPAFFVALADKTQGGFLRGSELSTDGLHHLRDVNQGGRIYSVWTSWTGTTEPPALSAVVDVLTRLEDHVGGGSELYSATSNGEETHIALSHQRDLFRIGGLFPQEAQLLDDITRAMQDLRVPLAIARALIAAEETAARAAPPTPP